MQLGLDEDIISIHLSDNDLGNDQNVPFHEMYERIRAAFNAEYTRNHDVVKRGYGAKPLAE